VNAATDQGGDDTFRRGKSRATTNPAEKIGKAVDDENWIIIVCRGL
jgi:hypothetical protein